MPSFTKLIFLIKQSIRIQLKTVVCKFELCETSIEFLDFLLTHGLIKSYVKQNNKVKIDFRFDSINKNIIQNLQLIGTKHKFTTIQITTLWKKNVQQGFFILSTSKGLMNNHKAQISNIGGKILLSIA